MSTRKWVLIHAEQLDVNEKMSARWTEAILKGDAKSTDYSK